MTTQERQDISLTFDQTKKDIALLGKSIKYFGAKGDGSADDTQAFIDAFSSKYQYIIIPKTDSFYGLTDVVIASGMSKKGIYANGAKILGTGNEGSFKRLFLLSNLDSFFIEGGEFGQLNAPKANGNNSQQVFEFTSSKNIQLNKLHIRDSAEMGAAFTECYGVRVLNSLIERCWRDGLFSQNCYNVLYENNEFHHIKDDAFSCHDVGVSTYRSFINSLGFAQAGDFKAFRNVVYNSYQGCASIGCNGVQIYDNEFYHTVLASISVTTVYDYFNNSFANNDPKNDATARDIYIGRNKSYYACSTTNIMGTNYTNNGQSGVGRGAISVIATGQNNQVFQKETKFVEKVTLQQNKVYNSGANGLFLYRINGLKWGNNDLQDCFDGGIINTLAGDVVEAWSITDYVEGENSVIDTRTNPVHRHNISYSDVQGSYGNLYGSRFVGANARQFGGVNPIDQNAQAGAYINKYRQVDAATNWSTYSEEGFTQIKPGGIWHVNGPTKLTLPCQLFVMGNHGQGNVVQLFIDFEGNAARRFIYNQGEFVSEFVYEFRVLRKAGKPLASDLAANSNRVIADTTTGSVYQCYSDGATLFAVQMNPLP